MDAWHHVSTSAAGSSEGILIPSASTSAVHLQYSSPLPPTAMIVHCLWEHTVGQAMKLSCYKKNLSLWSFSKLLLLIESFYNPTPCLSPSHLVISTPSVLRGLLPHVKIHIDNNRSGGNLTNWNFQSKSPNKPQSLHKVSLHPSYHTKLYRCNQSAGWW